MKGYADDRGVPISDNFQKKEVRGFRPDGGPVTWEQIPIEWRL